MASDEARRLMALALLALLVVAPAALRLLPSRPSSIPTAGCPSGAVRVDGRVVCDLHAGPRIEPIGELWLGRRLDLNRVEASTLSVVPGIGIKLATRIVEHRERHGPFMRLEDVEMVHGVGPRLRARMERYLAVYTDASTP